MSDEPGLLPARNDGASLLVVSPGRSSLVARGLQDAAILAQAPPSEPSERVSRKRREAELGDACAQYGLGIIYTTGLGVPQDFDEGVKWYIKAAEGHFADAFEALGKLYYEKQNYPEALRWLRSTTCYSGIAEGVLGECYYYGRGVLQDYAKAAQWFLEALHGHHVCGDPDLRAGYFLAYIYSFGMWASPMTVSQWRLPADRYAYDREQDHDRADEGHSWAQFNVALAYSYGRGVVQNDVEAAKWFRKAADAGEVDAQVHLGMAYFYGRGVTQDYVQAHRWANLAACASPAEWQNFFSWVRDRIAAKMTNQQIAEAQELARGHELNSPK